MKIEGRGGLDSRDGLLICPERFWPLLELGCLSGSVTALLPKSPSTTYEEQAGGPARLFIVPVQEHAVRLFT